MGELKNQTECDGRIKKLDCILHADQKIRLNLTGKLKNQTESDVRIKILECM